MEIVELVIRGDANHEVAAELGISVNTVKKMLRLVFDALGVTTRTELAARVNRALPHIGHARLPDGYTMVAIDPQTGATKTWG
jgi:DNA-binding CsgD family transcriptional regulator